MLDNERLRRTKPHLRSKSTFLERKGKERKLRERSRNEEGNESRDNLNPAKSTPTVPRSPSKGKGGKRSSEATTKPVVDSRKDGRRAQSAHVRPRIGTPDRQSCPNPVRRSCPASSTWRVRIGIPEHLKGPRGTPDANGVEGGSSGIRKVRPLPTPTPTPPHRPGVTDLFLIALLVLSWLVVVAVSNHRINKLCFRFFRVASSPFCELMFRK